MLTQNFILWLIISAGGGLLLGLLLLLHPLIGRWLNAEWQSASLFFVIVSMLFSALFFLPVEGLIIKINAGVGKIINYFFLADVEVVYPESNNLPDSDLLQLTSPENGGLEVLGAELLNNPAAAPEKWLQWPGWEYLAVIWLGVALLLLAFRLLAYLHFTKDLRQTSQPFDWQLIPLPPAETEKMREAAPGLTLRQQNNSALRTAPFLIGLFKPCLLLPAPEVAADLSARDWHNLLSHELTHYRRHDLSVKWLVFVCQCFHWFNPLVYLAGRRIEQYCEISCDLAVTGSFTEERRRDYMRTILHILSVSAAVSPSNKLYTSMQDDKKQIQRRFEMLSKPKKQNRYAALVMALFLSALIIAGINGTAYAAQLVKQQLPAVNISNQDSEIVVSSSAERISLQNAPFVAEDGTIYLPLRETLEKLGIIEKNDDTSLQYQDGVIKLQLYQWADDAAGGRVLSCFYMGQFTLTDDRVGAVMQEGVIYVPAELFMGMAQMSVANTGSSPLAGLMIIQYDKSGSEIQRLVSLPLPAENQGVNLTLPLAEQFAIVPQFMQAWQQSDYQKMQEFCTEYVHESVSWDHAGVMLGTAAAVYAEQSSAYPNSLLLHVKIKRQGISSSYSDLALDIEVAKQTDGKWLISSLRASNRDNIPVSDEAEQYWQFPITGSRIISYGFGGTHNHSGIDIPATFGKPVMAAAAGQVLAAGYMAEDGNKIILQHPQYGDWETRYAHLSSLAVQAGDKVEAGQVIGYVGSTGNSTGNHLHFSMLHEGQPVDPLPFFE